MFGLHVTDVIFAANLILHGDFVEWDAAETNRKLEVCVLAFGEQEQKSRICLQKFHGWSKVAADQFTNLDKRQNMSES